MKKWCFLILILCMLGFSGCSVEIDGKKLEIPDRPALGPTIERTDKSIVNVISQYRLNIGGVDGNITIKLWEEDFVQTSVVKKLTSPVTKKELLKLIDLAALEIDFNSTDIDIQMIAPEKLRPLSRFTADIEIMVPKYLTIININAGKGAIDVSGFKDKDMKQITITNREGGILITDCITKKYEVNLDKGSLKLTGLSGAGLVKLGYADAEVKELQGELDCRITSGKLTADRFDGKAKFDVSKGEMVITDSYLKAESSLFATNGNITADIVKLDKKGTYNFQAVEGVIKLALPDNTGFNLKTKTTLGKIDNEFKQELVGSGGPEIGVYVYKGRIIVKPI